MLETYVDVDASVEANADVACRGVNTHIED